MTQLPDGARNPLFFRVVTPLFAAMVTLGVFAAPAQAIERVPADYKGKFVTSCKSYGSKSFLDVGTGDCYTCPASAPSRSVFSVKGKKACFKKADLVYKKADRHGKPTGRIVKTKCPSGQFLDVGKGRCYSCERGYNRTARKVTSKKSCSKRIGKKYKSAGKPDGRHGCPDGSWRHGTTNKCYVCPKGSVRNAKIRLDKTPDKFDACTVTSLADAGTKARILAAAPAASKHSKAKRERLSLDLGEIVGEEQEKRDDPNGYRRNKMSEILEREKEDGFNVVTLMGGANISFVGGYGHMRGFAMGYNKDGDKVCREVFTNAGTLGISAGAGGGMEMGVWRINMEDVAGETNGVQGGISLLLSVASGIHWAPDGKWTKPSDYVGLTIVNGVTNSGTGAGAGSGAGLEAGIDYVHGWTKARCTVPCDELDWDDIPLLDSNSSCKGET